MNEEGVRALFVLSPFFVREYSELQIYVVGDCQIAIVLHPATARSMESTNVHLQLCVWYTVPALRLSFLRLLAAAKGEERETREALELPSPLRQLGKCPTFARASVDQYYPNFAYTVVFLRVFDWIVLNSLLL